MLSVGLLAPIKFAAIQILGARKHPDYDILRVGAMTNEHAVLHPFLGELPGIEALPFDLFHYRPQPGSNNTVAYFMESPTGKTISCQLREPGLYIRFDKNVAHRILNNDVGSGTSWFYLATEDSPRLNAVSSEILKWVLTQSPTSLIQTSLRYDPDDHTVLGFDRREKTDFLDVLRDLRSSFYPELPVPLDLPEVVVASESSVAPAPVTAFSRFKGWVRRSLPSRVSGILLKLGVTVGVDRKEPEPG